MKAYQIKNTEEESLGLLHHMVDQGVVHEAIPLNMDTVVGMNTS